MDLIDRYRKWKLTHANDSDNTDSDNSDNNDNDNSDSEWDIGTIRDQPAVAAAAASAAASQLIEQYQENGGDVGGSEVVSESVQQPSSLLRSGSPVKTRLEQQHLQQQQRQHQLSPLRESGNRAAAKSDLNIVSCCSIVCSVQLTDVDVFMMISFPHQPRSVAESRNSRSMEHLDRPVHERPDRLLADATATAAKQAAEAAAELQQQQRRQKTDSDERLRRRKGENRKSTPVTSSTGKEVGGGRYHRATSEGPAAAAAAATAATVISPVTSLPAAGAANLGSPGRSAAVLQNTVNRLLTEVSDMM